MKKYFTSQAISKVLDDAGVFYIEHSDPQVQGWYAPSSLMPTLVAAEKVVRTGVSWMAAFQQIQEKVTQLPPMYGIASLHIISEDQVKLVFPEEPATAAPHKLTSLVMAILFSESWSKLSAYLRSSQIQPQTVRKIAKTSKNLHLIYAYLRAAEKQGRALV